MNLKENLIELRERMLIELFGSSSFEFNATLENHSIGNQNIYRLYFVNYHRNGESYGRKGNNVGMINWPCKPFMLPKGMTREEAFKVLSYLTDFIEKKGEIKPCSLESVKVLDDVLDLERFGFTRVDESNEDKILNLFTVSGRLLLFKRSELYPKYFEWYVKNVTKREVKNIYSKYNMEFKDLILFDSQNKNHLKILKRDK